MSIQDLPALNAVLNSAATVLLLAGWRRIRRGDRTGHKRAMLAAVAVSAAFLASYLTYHFQTDAVTPFPRERFPDLALPYYIMLGSHVILAAICLPLVIATLTFALRDRLVRHRRLARITLPVWLYVSVTGVLIYLILYRWCA